MKKPFSEAHLVLSTGAYFPGFFGVLVFLGLIYNMVPGTERRAYLLYGIICAAGVVGAFLLLPRFSSRPRTGRFMAACLAVPALMILSAVGLLRLYELKYDAAPADVSASGTARVQFLYEEYYGYTGVHTLLRASAWITAGEQAVRSGEVVEIPLYETIEITGTVDFGLRGRRYIGTGVARRFFQESNVGETHRFRIKCGTESVVTGYIAVTARPYKGFWRVIFY